MQQRVRTSDLDCAGQVLVTGFPLSGFQTTTHDGDFHEQHKRTWPTADGAGGEWKESLDSSSQSVPGASCLTFNSQPREVNVARLSLQARSPSLGHSESVVYVETVRWQSHASN